MISKSLSAKTEGKEGEIHSSFCQVRSSLMRLVPAKTSFRKWFYELYNFFNGVLSYKIKADGIFLNSTLYRAERGKSR